MLRFGGDGVSCRLGWAGKGEAPAARPQCVESDLERPSGIAGRGARGEGGVADGHLAVVPARSLVALAVLLAALALVVVVALGVVVALVVVLVLVALTCVLKRQLEHGWRRGGG